MSNSVLTKREIEISVFLVDYLSKHGKTRLASQFNRVLDRVGIGVYSRKEFLSGVVRDAAFAAIKCACCEKDAKSLLDFSLLLYENGEFTKLHMAITDLDDAYNHEPLI